MATATGGCRCGATRYALAAEAGSQVYPLQVYACHCLDCQTWSGSAFTEQALLPADALRVEGPVATYAHTTPGGFESVQTVCGACHTRICNTNAAVPGMVVLRAGTLDASDRVAPVAHIWTRRKQPWLRLPDGVPAWAETPTPAEFAAALQKV